MNARSELPAANQSGGQLQALLASFQKIASQPDLAALFDLVAEQAARLANADRASVFLLDREKNELWSIAARGSKQIRFDARLGLAGAAALSGRTINTKDARRDPHFYARIDERTGYRTRSVLAVPLRNQRGEIIGTIQMLNKKGGFFTSDDESVIQTLVTQAGSALETAQLVKQLQQRQDELARESSHLWKELEGRSATQRIVGASGQIQEIVRLIEQISDSDVSVLITGESGTGKEMVARAIHFNSPRARRPFVSLNCAALPESLVESELFGIEKGVATGVDARTGKFEAADGGTLFLDEIGDLSLVAQAKILRTLQERAVEHVGGRKPIPINVRVVAATNKDLDAQAKKGQFRPDLYYRLNVIHIRTPALREIPEDIPVLAIHFLNKHRREHKKPALRLTAAATRCLVRYSWPGNVRELENEVRRLVVCARQGAIAETDLSEAIRQWGAGECQAVTPGRALKSAVADLEKRLIREALETTGHNQLRAAMLLGLSRQGFIKMMKRFGLK